MTKTNLVIKVLAVLVFMAFTICASNITERALIGFWRLENSTAEGVIDAITFSTDNLGTISNAIFRWQIKDGNRLQLNIGKETLIYDISLSQNGTFLTIHYDGFNYEGKYPSKATYRRHIMNAQNPQTRNAQFASEEDVRAQNSRLANLSPEQLQLEIERYEKMKRAGIVLTIAGGSASAVVYTLGIISFNNGLAVPGGIGMYCFLGAGIPMWTVGRTKANNRRNLLPNSAYVAPNGVKFDWDF